MSGKEVSDDAALAALLATAEKRQEQRAPPNKQHHQSNRGGPQGGRGGFGPSGGRGGRGPGRQQQSSQGQGKRDYYGPSSSSSGGDGGRGGGDGGGHRKRQRRWGGKEEPIPDLAWGGGSSSGGGDAQGIGPGSGEEANQEKKKADFGLSGALASDERTGNVYNGVLLKFSEPPEARAPNTRWRLYVFRKKKGSGDGNSNTDDDGDLIETLHVSRQSAYLFGRERKVADIPVDHPSLSKQHCVLQYRATPDASIGGRLRCRPYLMDLGSTNGTFINGVRIDDARYYELRKGDCITLGASSREYVLLTENSTETGTGVSS